MELLRFESPVARWQGYIMVRSYLNFPTLARWEKVVGSLGDGANPSLSAMVENILPFVCEFVDEWHMDSLPEKMTVEDLPGSPELLNWLVNVINEVFEHTTTIEADLPKELSSTSDTISPPPES